MFHPVQLCFEDRAERTFAMSLHRIIIFVLLFTCTVNPAPQDSNVTFLKIEPYQEYTPLAGNQTSRNENQPITISSFNNVAKNNTNTDSNTTFNAAYDAKIEISNQTNVSFENNEFLRHVRSDDVTTDLDQSETTTDQDIITEDDITTTIIPKTTTTIRPIPKFRPKLSSLKKSKKTNVPNSLNTFIAKTDKSYKRKFKSRCRCEKIENCPKLQITVPRCPDEYFLCCF